MDDIVQLENVAEAQARMLPPIAILAELTHRCPLQCPYCSNPLELERANAELPTADWIRAMNEAVDIGVLQIHFSGGEPTARKDLEELVRHAAGIGLYTNLITSGVLLDEDKLQRLFDAGLDHVQLSIQDADAANADRIGNIKDGHRRKLSVARAIRKVGLPLTMNAVVHRQNLHNLAGLIDLAVELEAARLEVAHVQYYGWALKNRASLMPTLEQLQDATATVEAARERLKGVLTIDYVVPDYYARRPKKCMDGWGRRFFNISPAGKVLPCHAAESITGLQFESIRDYSLAWIWENSPALNLYRGTDWMPPLCKTCDQREIDLGGCRCQAFALTGNAAETDPACQKSPVHDIIFDIAVTDSATGAPDYIYRRLGGA